jgi:DNA-binding transcriptional LysR family regulator
MHDRDLNLLTTLDALLREGSVTAAARRMHLSAPAMSRALTRVREALGDPVLVRAGRKLEPTPRALAMRAEVSALVERAHALLRPEGALELATLARTFTVRASDALVALAAARLAERVRQEAPQVLLRFAPEGDEDVESLRQGLVDLDLGHIELAGPEIRVTKLCDERFVGLVAAAHPLARRKVSLQQLVGHPHLSVSRRGRARGPLDEALAEHGLRRDVVAVVPTFGAAVLAVASSQVVAMVPEHLARAVAPLGLVAFELPLATPAFAVSQAWHPRFDNDAAHRWLRACVRELLGGGLAPPGRRTRARKQRQPQPPAKRAADRRQRK